MKKSPWILSLLIIVCSCVSQDRTNTVDEHSSTSHLISFFNKYRVEAGNAENDIIKKELFENREKELLNYIDSAAILTNLEGKIEKIEIQENRTGKTSLLQYNIEIAPYSFFTITFKCRHIIDKDSLASDSIYNRVKAMANYSTVYFDGIVSVEAEKNLPKTRNYSGGSSAFNRPEYYFHVVEISSAENDTLSDDLKETLHIGRDCMNYLFAKYRKEKYKYTEKEYKKQLQVYEESRKKLSVPEANYAKRYMNQLMLDLY